jgi:hypothetical protein
MRNAAILGLLAGILAAPLMAAEPLGPISFEFGVDYSKNCSEVDDRAACDSANMYGDRQGGANVRNGSHRINTIAVSSNPFSASYSPVFLSLIHISEPTRHRP